MVKQKQIDVLTAVARTPQRDAFLLYSDPYLHMQGVIVANERLSPVNSIDDLLPYKVAVVEGYVWDDVLSPRANEISVNRFSDLKTALVSTSRSVTDVTVSFRDAALFMINKEGLVDLNISGILPQVTKEGFGVRKDWLPLVSILNKGLASINSAERDAIREKWVGQMTPSIWTHPVYRTAVLATLGILLLSIVIVAIWNRMLNTRVLVRTRELKSAQAQLIQAEKMESLGRLAAGIAHEVKNPLAIIQMGFYYLSQEIHVDEKSSEVLNDIDDAVQRADTVIMGLLDFSHDRKLELKSGGLDEVVVRSLHLVAHEMRQRNINVATDLSDDLPNIMLDANKLQQVLINLFMNSAQAMERDGNLHVASCIKTLDSREALDCDHENNFTKGERVLWLEVTDTGPGIREEDRHKIFDPFYTTKPVGEGTGLGMSVSRSIMNSHHGSIDIRNLSKGGASVVLIFKLMTGKNK